MSGKVKIVIYVENTGELVKEIPINFWFSHGEDNIKDRHFNLEVKDMKLKEGQAARIELPASVVFKEILNSLRAK